MQRVAEFARTPGSKALAEAPQRQSIALVMIVRDEARCIERCLNSVRPWVDQMLVLDTGSRDATPQIAQRCGALVKQFSWVDDFSAARNAALAFTDAPWRLVLDADEWLVGGGEALAELRGDPPAFLGLIQVASRIDPGQTDAPSWLPRLLPAGVRYSGRIHEQPESALPRRRLRLRVAHDGYLAAQRAAKAGRNRRLLEMALAQDPDDAYWNYQLGKDLEVNSEFAQAEPCYARANAGAAADAAWRHDLVVRWLFTLKKLGAGRRCAAHRRRRAGVLGAFARLPLHARGRALGVRHSASATGARAVAEDRGGVGTRAADRRAARPARHGARPRQLPRRAQPGRVPCKPRPRRRSAALGAAGAAAATGADLELELAG